MITMKLLENEKQMILAGDVTEISFEVTKESQKNYVRLGFDCIKPGTNPAETERISVVFVNNDYIDWQARICSMGIDEGTSIYLSANKVVNDRQETQYYGNVLGYYTKTGFEVKLHTEENTPEQRFIVGLLSNYSRPTYTEPSGNKKGKGTLAVSVRKWNKEKKENYFQTINLTRTDKDAEEGKVFADMFKGKTGVLGMFVTYGDKYITDKQVDKENPTSIYYNCINASLAPMPDPREAAGSAS